MYKKSAQNSKNIKLILFPKIQLKRFYKSINDLIYPVQTR